MRAAVPHVVARRPAAPSRPVPDDDECFYLAGLIPPMPEAGEVGRAVLENHAPRGGENDQQQEDDPDPVEPGKALIAGLWGTASGGRLAHRLPLSAPSANSCPAEGLARAYPRWWSGQWRPNEDRTL